MGNILMCDLMAKVDILLTRSKISLKIVEYIIFLSKYPFTRYEHYVNIRIDKRRTYVVLRNTLDDSHKRFGMDESIKGEKLQPVGTVSVVDQTISSIIDAISNGTYKVGQKLPNEYELISELHISRNSLREAMRVLSTLGIVEIRRGDGTYVCDQINPSVFDSMVYGLAFDASSSAELFELRQSLDEIMLKLSMDKAVDSDIAELERLVELMEKSFKDGDTITAAEADFSFHIKMSEMCNNKLLSRIIKGIYQFYKKSIKVNITTEQQFAHAAEYHRELLNVIKNKERDRVEEVVSKSLESWRNHIKR